MFCLESNLEKVPVRPCPTTPRSTGAYPMGQLGDIQYHGNGIKLFLQRTILGNGFNASHPF